MIFHYPVSVKEGEKNLVLLVLGELIDLREQHKNYRQVPTVKYCNDLKFYEKGKGIYIIINKEQDAWVDA